MNVVVYPLAFCVLCGMEVPHERGRVEWRALPHPAPCGRLCAGGGVGYDAYALGARVHRGPDCPCTEDDE